MSALGRIAFGLIADHLGRLNIFFIYLFMSGLSIALFWLPAKTFAMCAVFSVAYGLFSVGYCSLTYVVVTVIFGWSDHSKQYLIMTRNSRFGQCAWGIVDFVWM